MSKPGRLDGFGALLGRWCDRTSSPMSSSPEPERRRRRACSTSLSSSSESASFISSTSLSSSSESALFMSSTSLSSSSSELASFEASIARVSVSMSEGELVLAYHGAC